MPNLGFAKTAWGIGIAVVGVSIAFAGARIRSAAALGLCAALLLAFGFESGVGRDRVQGWGQQQARILDYAEGPDSTVAVIEGAGARVLVIDGFSASGNYQAGSAHYMEWMGRLPMLLHPDPKDALVICLGTGQTVKGALQALIGTVFAGIFESLVLGAKAGVKGETLYNVIASTGVGCPLFENCAKLIMDRKFEGTGSHIGTMYKDLGLSLDMARENGVPMFTTGAAFELFQAGISSYPEGDNWSIVKLLERIAGTEVKW